MRPGRPRSSSSESSTAYAAEPNDIYNLQHTLMAAKVLDVDEMDLAVRALLSGQQSQQHVVYAQLGRTVARFTDLDTDDQAAFRGALTAYVRAYAFLAQIMTWTDRELERLYLFGKALATQLPRSESDPMPLVSDQVELTHLRTALTAEEENAALSARARTSPARCCRVKARAGRTRWSTSCPRSSRS